MVAHCGVSVWQSKHPTASGRRRQETSFATLGVACLDIWRAGKGGSASLPKEARVRGGKGGVRRRRREGVSEGPERRRGRRWVAGWAGGWRGVGGGGGTLRAEKRARRASASRSHTTSRTSSDLSGGGDHRDASSPARQPTRERGGGWRGGWVKGGDGDCGGRVRAGCAARSRLHGSAWWLAEQFQSMPLGVAIAPLFSHPHAISAAMGVGSDGHRGVGCGSRCVRALRREAAACSPSE